MFIPIKKDDSSLYVENTIFFECFYIHITDDNAHGFIVFCAHFVLANEMGAEVLHH